MKTTRLLFGGLMLVANSFLACTNTDTSDLNTMVNATDSAFVLNAGMSNTATLDASQLALIKSLDTAILNFAQRMVNEHTAAQASLKRIAGKYQLQVPDSVDAEHVQAKIDLLLLDGRSFDSMYIHRQVADHQQTIDLYQHQLANGNNQDLKDFADTTLPKLQMHHQLASTIAASY